MTAKDNGSLPATGVGVTCYQAGDDIDRPTGKKVFGGLTKREAFAMAAMQGLCLQTSATYSEGACNDAIVRRSIVLADALLAELARED